uniref:alpha/beta fold hydrolase n=1 Tax=Stappia sp. TaxID=1870903 RepID=UPI003BABCE13
MPTEPVVERTRSAYAALDEAFVKARLDGHAHFLNWGYEPVPGLADDALPGLVRPGSNETSERLVAELVGPVSLDNLRMADIGCGRGGALDVILRRFHPLSATGLDLSADNIAGARRLLAGRRVRLQVADACAVPLADASQDIVLNLESSGAYPNMGAFLRHVRRVLVPGGFFLHGDLWPAELVDPLIETMEEMGFALESLRDVTRQVCRARDRMPAGLMARLAGSRGAAEVQDYFAAPGSAMYDCLDRGSIAYLLCRWRRGEDRVESADPAVLQERAARIEELLEEARASLAERSEWFPFGGPRHGADVNILAFPHAVAGASAFKNWQARFPRDWQVSPVQLPGREGRIAEPPFTTLSAAVEALMLRVRPYRDTPLVLVGWSLGSKIAFELARRLEHDDICQPLLVVAGVCPGPHQPLPDLSSFFGEDGMETRLRLLGGTPENILSSGEMLSALQTTMEGDTAMAASYRSEATIRAPMLALSATRDDLVSQEAVESWRPRTAGGFTHRRLEGGHFMARDDAAAVADVVREAVAARLNQDLRPVEVA